MKQERDHIFISYATEQSALCDWLARRLAAELAAARSRLSEMVRDGNRHVQGELSKVKQRQRSLTASRSHRLAELQAEPDLIQAGEIEFLVHALVVPTCYYEENSDRPRRRRQRGV